MRRRRPEPPPAWSVAPVRGPLDPATRVRVLGSERLRLGLAEVWTVVAHNYPRTADFAVVELSPASRQEWRLEPPPLAEPYVVWVTAGGGPPEPNGPKGAAVGVATPEPESDDDLRSVGVRLLSEAAAVFVADAEHLADWQAVVPGARLLPAAASARVLPARERSGVAVVATGPIAPEVVGAATTVVAKALRPLEESIVARRVETTATLPRLISYAVSGSGSYAEARDAIGSAAVLADGLRCSRHDTWTVLDAAAAGTPVVSVAGLPQPFDVVGAATEQGYRAEVAARLHQPELRDREGLRLRRAVLAGHSWARRAEVILAAGGLDTALVPRAYSTSRGVSTSRPSVSAIVPTNRTHELDNVFANLARQRHTDLELVLVLHGLDVDESELRKRAADAGVSTLEIVNAPPSYTLGACLNAGIEVASGDYVAKMDDDNHYGAHYLTDLLHGFETSGAGIVGKWAHYVWLQSTGAVVLRYPDAEHSYQRRIQGGSMLFDGDLLRTLRFADLPRAVDSDILDRAIADGVKVWSGDRFNYVSIRGVDRQAHTWAVEDATFLTASGRLEFYGDPRAHVEV